MSDTSISTGTLERLALLEHDVPAGAAGALAGALAASLLSTACKSALDDCTTTRVEEELRSISDKAMSLRRDLLMLLEQGIHADGLAAAMPDRPAAGGRADARRLRALLFASEVPLRTAQTCHVLLKLSERALLRIGMRSIPEIGTAGALAFTGVAAGVLVARTWLAGIPEGSGTGASAARARAERILIDAEVVRTTITDRVSRHLP